MDASALVAMIAQETEAVSLLSRFNAEQSRLCSAVAAWEAVAGLCKTYRLTPLDAHRQVAEFLELASIHIVAIAEREFQLASDAFAVFGKGRHPAALNMGDCFAYACAKSNSAKLLFIGDDFTRTDIAGR